MSISEALAGAKEKMVTCRCEKIWYSRDRAFNCSPYYYYTDADNRERAKDKKKNKKTKAKAKETKFIAAEKQHEKFNVAMKK